jgi:hypothetical protein
MLPQNGFLIDRSSKKQVCGTRNMLDELVEVLLMKHRRTNNTKTYPMLQFHHSHAMLPKNGFLIDRGSKKQACGTTNMLDELVEVVIKHRRTHAFQQQNGFLIGSESISIGWEKKLKCWMG